VSCLLVSLLDGGRNSTPAFAFGLIFCRTCRVLAAAVTIARSSSVSCRESRFTSATSIEFEYSIEVQLAANSNSMLELVFPSFK
jgi:hypothetical protein